MFKYVTEADKTYQFQSPPTVDQKKKADLKSQQNRFDDISKESFYFPCKKTRYRKPVSEDSVMQLEEITDRKVLSHFLPTDAEETQLSPYFPKFVNRVETKDIHTQTETCDANPVQYVYNFYIEVIPILERLVGYTIEQAMIEIESEEEVLLRKKANATFAEIAGPERIEVNRRREEAYRLNEEIRRRIIEVAVREDLERLQLEKDFNAVVAESLTRDVLGYGVKKVTGVSLDKPVDTVEDDIVENLLPVLLERAYACPILSLEVKARVCMDAMIREACDGRR